MKKKMEIGKNCSLNAGTKSIDKENLICISILI